MLNLLASFSICEEFQLMGVMLSSLAGSMPRFDLISDWDRVVLQGCYPSLRTRNVRRTTVLDVHKRGIVA